MCETYDALFSEIQKACSVLTDYGVQPRYPHEIQIEEHHMKKALEYARQINEFAPLQTAKLELEKQTNPDISQAVP